MSPIILDGKAYADAVCSHLAEKVRTVLSGTTRVPPALAIVSSGNDPASMTYLNNKLKRCVEIGINVTHIHLNKVTETDIKTLTLVKTPIIFQLPIATDSSINARRLLQQHMRSPMADVDGFCSTENLARLYTTNVATPDNLPCTPYGIIKLLEHYDIPISGKTACVIGRSDIVGHPVARMLEMHDATVIQCHSKTPHDVLVKMLELSDIIVSAVGMPCFINSYTFTPEDRRGQRIDISKKVFIDVGINRDENGQLCGDISDGVKERSYAYTPVPGGVGPVTVAMLMYNTVRAWMLEHGAGNPSLL